jgi:hypothetical protein
MKITNLDAKEMAYFICSHLAGEINQSYLKCDVTNHVLCECKAIHGNKLNTYNGSLERYLANLIERFIEGESI